jgi:hypothetical protein
MTELRHGIIKAYDSGTHKATVQLTGSLGIWLPSVPVNQGLVAGDMVVGRQCAVALMDESNPADAVVAAVYGGLPAGGGGAMLLVRRDSPEIILPDSASSGAKSLGSNNALTGTWAEICSASEFGGSERTLIGMVHSQRTGKTLTATGSTSRVRQGRVRLATCAAGSEARLMDIAFGGSAFTQLIIDSGSATAIGLATPSVFYPCGAVRVAASTRISFDGAVNDNDGQTQARTYLLAYDPASWTLDELFDLRDWHEGDVALDSRLTDFMSISVPSGGSAWGNSSWVTVTLDAGATTVADHDYLVTDLYTGCTTASIDAQADIAVGDSGSEVIQSRVCAGAATALFGTAAYHPPMPFLWPEGERLAVRARVGAGSAETVAFHAQLVRVS